MGLGPFGWFACLCRSREDSFGIFLQLPLQCVYSLCLIDRGLFLSFLTQRAAWCGKGDSIDPCVRACVRACSHAKTSGRRVAVRERHIDPRCIAPVLNAKLSVFCKFCRRLSFAFLLCQPPSPMLQQVQLVSPRIRRHWHVCAMLLRVADAGC